MSIVEAIVRRYYHGSIKNFPEGFILEPQDKGYASILDDEIRIVEDFLNKYRPEGMLPRQKSVFMASDIEHIDYLGGYTDYIFEVEPLGRVFKNDAYWYGHLAVYLPYNPIDDELIQAARNYWNGTLGPRKNALVEYRTEAAKIIRLVEDNS